MDPAQALSAPQATLMTTISQGIFTNHLEWTYILTGVGLGIVLITLDAFMRKTSDSRFALPVLAVGIGIYLPTINQYAGCSRCSNGMVYHPSH